MQERLYSPDTICAEASPSGKGGVSVIRVSGVKSFSLFKELFFKSEEPQDRKVYYKKLYDDRNSLIDEVIVFGFSSDKSFSGEPCFEIQSHGSPIVVTQIIDFLLSYGVRLADPGEFSYRAYLNGKMDLAQAEGIHQLIHANSKKVKDMSTQLLSGNFSIKLNSLRDKVVFALSRLEVLIDFTEQDIDLDQENIILESLNTAESELSEFINTYNSGKAHIDGIKVALVGPPNSGKSSLFNSLLAYDRSIVSEQAGTTRDYVSSRLFLSNFSCEIIDTAGIRTSVDKIETLGVDKSVKIANEAQLILLLVSEDTVTDFMEYYKMLPEHLLKSAVLLKTKKDQSVFDLDLDVKKQVQISTFLKEDINHVKSIIEDALEPFFANENSLFVERHYECLSKAIKNLQKAKNLEVEGNEDIISSLLYACLSDIDEVLNIENPEEVRDKIFSDFCLGK